MDKKENIGKKNRLLQFGVLIVALIMIVSSGVYATIYITDEGSYDSDYNNEYLGGLEAEYVISTDGTNFYCKNGSNGMFEYVSDNAYSTIQYALNISSGVVFIKPGSYEIDNTLRLYGGVSIVGSSIRDQTTAPYKGTIIELADGSNCDMINITTREGSSQDYFSRIEDIYLYGNKEGQSSNCDVIVNRNSHSDVYINHIIILNAYQYGINVSGTSSWYWRINNCWIENSGNYDIIFKDADNCWIDKNVLYSGIKIDTGSTYNRITNNRIVGNVDLITIDVNSGWTKIKDNMITQSYRAGIKVGVGTYFIEGNFLYNIGYNGSAYSDHDGIWLANTGGATFAKVTDNTLINIGGDGIYNHAHYHSVISNNHISAVSKYSSGQRHCIHMFGSDDCVISNNYLDGTSSKYSIYLNEADRNTVSCNVFENMGTKYVDILSSNDNVFEGNSCPSGLVELINDGTRTIVNGISYNNGVPGSAGGWITEIVDGIHVWDIGNSTLYICANNSWHQIQLV